MALPIPRWSKDSFTEQSVAFRFQCPVVDGFRLLNFTMDFTAGGIPDLRRLRALADFDVTAEERDAAWKAVSESL